MIGDLPVRAESCLPLSAAIPRYLRFADRTAVLVAEGASDADVQRCLANQVQVLAESHAAADLIAAVIGLAVVDRAFRAAGLWPGNIYLAGIRALPSVLGLAGVGALREQATEAALRELAALELAYLFPVAGKFRSGGYDGEIQYRLNGWGRALAHRLTVSLHGAALAAASRSAISQHLTAERPRYAAFLAELDVARQDYGGDQLDRALALPIPVLV